MAEKEEQPTQHQPFKKKSLKASNTQLSFCIMNAWRQLLCCDSSSSI